MRRETERAVAAAELTRQWPKLLLDVALGHQLPEERDHARLRMGALRNIVEDSHTVLPQLDDVALSLVHAYRRPAEQLRAKLAAHEALRAQLLESYGLGPAQRLRELGAALGLEEPTEAFLELVRVSQGLG